MRDDGLPYPKAPWGPWIAVPKQYQTLCAVIGCKTLGRPQKCPADGNTHHHGCIHYEHTGEELYARHRLQLRTGWGLICDEHYALVAAIIHEQRVRRGK
jgi:hypothetical protein